MIKIKKSPTADTRTAKEKVSKEVLLSSSHQHIVDVQKAMNFFMEMMKKSAAAHDNTKISGIAEFHNDFAHMQSGKPGNFVDMHWYKDLHLKERHHLKARCPDDVNLIDVMEMIADIVMAGMARAGKVYDDDLSADVLMKAYKNTIELLAKNTVVEDPKDVPTFKEWKKENK